MRTTPYETCSYVLTRGTVCESPALTGEKFCYFHHRDHQRKLNLQEARQLKTSDHFYKYPEQQKLLDPEILESLDIPALDDRESIQVAVSTIVRAVLSGHISEKRAGLALFGCQVAVSNIGKVRIGISEFEVKAEKIATADPNPIQPLIDTQPPKAGYQDELAAARKLIDAAQKMQRTTAPPVRPHENVSPAQRSETTAPPQIRHSDEFSSQRGGGTPQHKPAPLNCHSERSEEPASSRETRNKKRETAPRETRNLQRETSDERVRVWTRPPGPNSKTFAEHVKIADAQYKGTIAAEQFKKEQKREQRNGTQSNGSSQ